MDLYALLAGDSPGAGALADALQRQRQMGMLGQLSGDRVLSPLGQGLQRQAQEQAQADLDRQRYANEAARIAQLAQHQGATTDVQRANADAQLTRAGLPPRFQPEGAPPPAPAPSPAAPPATRGAPLRAGKQPMSAGKALMGGVDDAGLEDIAKAIMEGRQPPVLTGLYRAAPGIRAKLAKNGFDLSAAQVEWDATKRHLATMNGQQQERLRQAINFTAHSLDKIDELYNQWQKVGPASGFRVFNRAALASAKQVGGEAGAVAQALEAQINDLTAEMANVYMGGNSPTDHALSLAKENLSADWNEKTFKMAIDQARRNLKLRANAMVQAPVAGLPNGSRYAPAPAAQALSPEDQAAKAWADANPADPRAAKILEKLKAKGL